VSIPYVVRFYDARKLVGEELPADLRAIYQAQQRIANRDPGLIVNNLWFWGVRYSFDAYSDGISFADMDESYIGEKTKVVSKTGIYADAKDLEGPIESTTLRPLADWADWVGVFGASTNRQPRTRDFFVRDWTAKIRAKRGTQDVRQHFVFGDRRLGILPEHGTALPVRFSGFQLLHAADYRNNDRPQAAELLFKEAAWFTIERVALATADASAGVNAVPGTYRVYVKNDFA
jgi:hypothetical protein